MTLPEQGGSIVRALSELLVGRPLVRLVLLFGSGARGTAQGDSDVDLAIDAPAVEIDALRGLLGERFDVEVDFLRLADATIPLLDALVRDSKIVYEAHPGIAARWRSRILADLEIDRPGYGRMRDAWLRKVANQGLVDGQ